MSIGAGLSRLVSEMETVKRERDEFAAALAVQKSQMNAAVESARKDCEKALFVLSGIGILTPQEGYGINSSWAISDLCRAVRELKAHDAQKDYLLRLASEHRDELEAKIRQLRNALAETARGLLTQPYERDRARVIARFLGYTNPSDEWADVEAFLSSVSVEEPKT